MKSHDEPPSDEEPPSANTLYWEPDKAGANESYFRDCRLAGATSCFSFFIKTLPVQVIVCDISMVTTLRSKFAAMANQLDM